jgi:hypothetical protein
VRAGSVNCARKLRLLRVRQVQICEVLSGGVAVRIAAVTFEGKSGVVTL